MNAKLEAVVGYLLARAMEPTTVRGAITMAVVVYGLKWDDAHIGLWTTAAVMVSSILKIIVPDDWSRWVR